MGGSIPVTPTFISAKKKLPHRIFRFRDDLPNLANIDLRNHGVGLSIDVKIGHSGKGSQSVFPPSFEGKYCWLPELSPDRCSVADIPDQFITWLHNALGGGLNPSKEEKSPSVRQALYEQREVGEGSRDATIYAEACALWREQNIIHGSQCFESPDCEVTVFERLWSFNRAKCRPPLDDTIVRQKCDGARQFILQQALKKDDSPKLTSLGLEFRDGEWFPGEWRAAVINCDPRRVRLFAPFLPHEYIELLLADFDMPTEVHRAVLGETGTICLAHKPGFWPGIWNGAKIKDAKTGKPRVTTGLKAKLLQVADWIEAPLEEKREAVIAMRVLEWLTKTTPMTGGFDPLKVGSKSKDDGGSVWFRFNALLSALSMSDDKITRNELSSLLTGDRYQLAVTERVRGPEGRRRFMRVSPDKLMTLEQLAHGAEK